MRGNGGTFLSSGCAWGILDVDVWEVPCGGLSVMRALVDVRLIGLASIAVLDGEAWVAIGCCYDGCAFEVEVADACRSAATEGRARTFTTCTTIEDTNVLRLSAWR